MKKKTLRCCHCNKFITDESKHVYEFNTFSNISVKTFIHKRCWDDLSPNMQIEMISGMANRGNIPIDPLYFSVLDMYRKESRITRDLKIKLEDLELELHNYQKLTGWNKYPKILPPECDLYWVTLENRDVVKCEYTENGFASNTKVLAWCYILIPSYYNDLCYEKLKLL